MTCPYLEYRDLETADTDVARAYCTAAEAFVQPLRADICNDRYELSHERDCEIYRAHADDVGDRSTVDATEESDDQELPDILQGEKEATEKSLEALAESIGEDGGEEGGEGGRDAENDADTEADRS